LPALKLASPLSAARLLAFHDRAISFTQVLANSIWSRTMRLISTLIVCLGLSACATDYASQLDQPNFGVRRLQYTESDVDPTMLMNGTYASKKMNGLYGSAFCLNAYRCSQQAQQSSPGWDP
jgi:hypothetical protein